MSNIRLHIILDNIRSAFNVGSIFRTADATGCAKIYICGITPNIDNPKLQKTALGAIQSVESEYHGSTETLIEKLKGQGIPIFGVELTQQSQHFQKAKYPKEIGLVFGHEIRGVSRKTQRLCDKLVYIPMKGMKESLNVATAAGIVLFEALRER